MKMLEPTAGGKVRNALNILGFPSVDAFADRLETLIGKPPKLTEDEIEQYTGLAQLQKGSMANTPAEVSADVIRGIWEKQNQLS